MKIEEKLDRLNQITAEMESGTLSLEDSLKRFEECIRLVRECSSEIDRAEKTIRVIQDGEAAGLSGEGPDGETGAVSEEGRNRGTQAAPEENPDLDAETGAVPEADGFREAEE